VSKLPLSFIRLNHLGNKRLFATSTVNGDDAVLSRAALKLLAITPHITVCGNIGARAVQTNDVLHVTFRWTDAEKGNI